MLFSVNFTTFLYNLWWFKVILAKVYPLVLESGISVTIHWIDHFLVKHSLLGLFVR